MLVGVELFCLYAQTPEGEKAAEMAIREPWKFVLKPQKEGGGVCRRGGMCCGSRCGKGEVGKDR